MKVLVEDEEVHPYKAGQLVTLPESEAKKLEVPVEGEGSRSASLAGTKRYAVPVGGWTGEKDQGESTTDEEVGAGYGPQAVAARKSNVAQSFTEDEREADKNAGDEAYEPGRTGASVAERRASEQAASSGGSPGEQSADKK